MFVFFTSRAMLLKPSADSSVSRLNIMLPTPRLREDESTHISGMYSWQASLFR